MRGVAVLSQAPGDYAAPTAQRSVPIIDPSSDPRSFYWYDLETTGTDPAADRIIQFAGIRTDADLNEIEAPRALYVHWPIDVLPDPFSCAVTGLTPQRVNERATPELEAYVEINRLFSQPGTCVVGFNSLRFDDEFVRYALYRHLLDPYAREWQDGNSRWDIIDLARAAAALRPEGMNWPTEDGLPSFRLEALTAANGIAHEVAHDALWDVRATIGVARLIRRQQPRLFDYALRLRDRAAVRLALRPENPAIALHVSRMFPRERHCIAPVMPVARHPTNRNAVIVADLTKDVRPLIEWDTSRLREALFGTDRELRPGLKEVRFNRCPFVAPLSVLRDQDMRRLGIDVAEVTRRFDELVAHREVTQKVASIYAAPREFKPRDVDADLYGGFLDDVDRARCRDVVATLLDGRVPTVEFADARLDELLFRLRARRDASCLSVAERKRWVDWMRAKLVDGTGGGRTLAEVREALGRFDGAPEIARDLTDHLATLERMLSPPSHVIGA